MQTLRSDRQGVATAEIEQLFGAQVFTFPKPSSLIRELVRATAGEGDLVLDFFAGSGTTGAAILSLNAEDDADRRFILVSSTESTELEPEKNLCRDVCAERLRKVIAGEGRDGPVPGDFAYLRTRRIAWDDVLYELDDAEVWLLLQLRHARVLRAFDTAAALQIAPPDPDRPEEATIAFLPEPTDTAVAEVRRLALLGPVVAFSLIPGPLRDALALPAVPIEQVPGQLLSEFPRLIAGL